MSKNISLVREALAAGEGIVRLAPCWVPRSFLMPGGRLKLDPRDLYALGAHRGGIDERWFSSTTKAANGPGTPDDEGPQLHRHRRPARAAAGSRRERPATRSWAPK
jgi:hypothetical protein